jgi:hypothetical protein
MFWLMCLLLSAMALVIVWVVPKIQVSGLKADGLDRFEQENEARKTLATIVGGAAVIATIYSTTMTLDATREGQLTDRYAKAVEQLGANRSDEPNIEVRLGGIYALARIAKDSSRDEGTIEEVLTAYIRQNAPASDRAACSSTVRPRADLQAIIWILGEQSHASGKKRPAFNLRKASLCGYSIENRDFSGSYFTRSDMRLADFRGSKLIGAWLEDVDFRNADLRKAELNDAKLGGADLRDAHLQGANLTGAILEEADIRGADLTEVRGLCLEQLARARRDQLTRVPKDLPACEVKK